MRPALALALCAFVAFIFTPCSTGSAPARPPALTGAPSRIDFTQPADWLGRNAALLGDRRLAEVILPGAHDAASYSVSSGSGVCRSRINPLAALSAFFMAPRARAQEVPIGAQLAAGVRYLDLR